MAKRYRVDFTIGCWYVYDKKTYKVVREFKTRVKAREYAKWKNK